MRISTSGEQIELTRLILAATSGPACRRAQHQLADLADHKLNGFEWEIITSHLALCSSCSLVASTLHELQQWLPGLASLDPGEALTQAVLQATQTCDYREYRSKRLAWTAKRLSDRPRVAWEVAYAATLLLFLLLGRPAVPVLAAATEEPLGAVKAELREALQSIPAARFGAWLSADAVAGKIGAIAQTRRELDRPISRLLGWAHQWKHAATTLAARNPLRGLVRNLKGFWLLPLNHPRRETQRNSILTEP